jgi:hypothetical protein
MSFEVSNAFVSMTKVISLPSFLDLIETPLFSFFNSSSDYVDRYLKAESYDNGGDTSSIKVLGTHALLPQEKSHTMHSIWKAFRYPVDKKIQNYDKIAFFLPMVFDLDTAEFSYSGSLEPDIRVTLYPFGSVSITMKILFLNMPLDEFNAAIRRMRTKPLINSQTFSNFAEQLAMNINYEITGNKIIEAFPDPHNFIFLYDFSPTIRYNANSRGNERFIYERILVSILNQIPYSQAAGITQVNIQKQLQNRFVGRLPKEDEHLFFQSHTTLIYASPSWYVELIEQFGKQKALDKLDCMRQNYEDFVNIITALNRFIKSVLRNGKYAGNPTKRKQFIECVREFFPNLDLSQSLLANKKNLFTISNIIGLATNLESIRNEETE